MAGHHAHHAGNDSKRLQRPLRLPRNACRRRLPFSRRTTTTPAEKAGGLACAGIRGADIGRS